MKCKNTETSHGKKKQTHICKVLFSAMTFEHFKCDFQNITILEQSVALNELCLYSQCNFFIFFYFQGPQSCQVLKSEIVIFTSSTSQDQDGLHL